MFETGFKVGGDKYFTLKADDRSVYGKKVSQPSTDYVGADHGYADSLYQTGQGRNDYRQDETGLAPRSLSRDGAARISITHGGKIGRLLD